MGAIQVSGVALRIGKLLSKEKPVKAKALMPHLTQLLAETHEAVGREMKTLT